MEAVERLRSAAIDVCRGFESREFGLQRDTSNHPHQLLMRAVQQDALERATGNVSDLPVMIRDALTLVPFRKLKLVRVDEKRIAVTDGAFMVITESPRSDIDLAEDPIPERVAILESTIFNTTTYVKPERVRAVLDEYETLALSEKGPHVDVELLRLFLPHAARIAGDDAVCVSWVIGSLDVIRFRGRGWTAFAMPIRNPRGKVGGFLEPGGGSNGE